jgi:hypothetical protein
VNIKYELPIRHSIPSTPEEKPFLNVFIVFGLPQSGDLSKSFIFFSQQSKKANAIPFRAAPASSNGEGKSKVPKIRRPSKNRARPDQHPRVSPGDIHLLNSSII